MYIGYPSLKDKDNQKAIGREPLQGKGYSRTIPLFTIMKFCDKL